MNILKMKLKKGTYGYIAAQKKQKLLLIFCYLLIAAVIFLLGLFLNRMSKANIFTVLAILCVLPWARQVVAWVVFFPYHSVSWERYEQIKALTDRMDGARLLTDLVITSQDKVMNLDFVIIGAGSVWLEYGKDGQDQSYIRSYLTKGIHNLCDFELIFTGEDEELKTGLSAFIEKKGAAQSASGETDRAVLIENTESDETASDRTSIEKTVQEIEEYLSSLIV